MPSSNKLPEFKVGQRVEWRDGKRPRLFGEGVKGTVDAPPRPQSGDTVYVDWDGHGVMPCSGKAIRPL